MQRVLKLNLNGGRAAADGWLGSLRSFGAIFADLASRLDPLVRALPCSFWPMKRVINAVEHHFYQVYFVAMFCSALLHSHYSLLRVLPNVLYLWNCSLWPLMFSFAAQTNSLILETYNERILSQIKLSLCLLKSHVTFSTKLE